jgi:HEPN domain-containing protein
MIAVSEIEELSRARLLDAEALLDAGRYDGTIYLCGYAVGLALKARICKTLDWSGFPSTNSEFNNYQSFRTHNLDVLLRLSGRHVEIKTNYFAQWSAVVEWNPEARYKPIGSTQKADVKLMLFSAKALLRFL